MGFKKVISSADVPFVIGSTQGDDELFPPGYSYILNNLTYTVTKIVKKDPNTDMRRVLVSDGSTEIVDVNVIKKDIADSNTQILPLDKRYVVKTEEEQVEEKKTPTEKKDE